MITKKQLRLRVFDMRCLVSKAVTAVGEMMALKATCPKCGFIQSRSARQAQERAETLLRELRAQANTQWNEPVPEIVSTSIPKHL